VLVGVVVGVVAVGEGVLVTVAVAYGEVVAVGVLVSSGAAGLLRVTCWIW
jgi:hypothetical protein